MTMLTCLRDLFCGLRGSEDCQLNMCVLKKWNAELFRGQQFPGHTWISFILDHIGLYIGYAYFGGPLLACNVLISGEGVGWSTCY